MDSIDCSLPTRGSELPYSCQWYGSLWRAYEGMRPLDNFCFPLRNGGSWVSLFPLVSRLEAGTNVNLQLETLHDQRRLGCFGNSICGLLLD